MATNTIFTVDYTNPGLHPFSEELENDDQYLVEALLGTRVHRGKKQYLVSWIGEWSPAEKTTWEPAKNVSQEIFQELERSGVVLPSYPSNDGYRSEPKDDVMDLDGDSGSEYDPDDDKDKAHKSSKAKARLRRKSDKANRSRKAKARLPKKSSNVSDDDVTPSSDQHGDDSRSPVIAGPATQAEQIDQEQIDDEHALALKGDALIAEQNAELQVMDANWENLWGEPLNYNPMLQQAAQQPMQAPTITQNGSVNFAQQPYKAPSTVGQNGFLNLFQQPMQHPPAPMLKQPGFAAFSSDPTLTVDNGSYEFLNFAAREDPYDSDEDADGSVISAGEQARYDAMSLWRHM